MAYIDGQYKDTESYINDEHIYHSPNELKDDGYKSSESYIIGGHNYHSSNELKDDGYKSSESYINEGTHYYNPSPSDFGDYGYKSSESYINEGIYASYGGPMIDFKKPSELIEDGSLTPQNITEEQQKLIHDDILLGVTNNKDLLAKKIDLIISNDNLVNSLVQTQYNLAIEELKKSNRGFYNEGVQDRKFQFLTTVKMLTEKGYDITKLNFGKDKDMPLFKLLSEFKNNCDKYHANSMKNASWFKDGKAPEGYDMKRSTSPFLFSGMLLTEIYVSNPKIFEEEYSNFQKNSRYPSNKNLSFENFMLYKFGVKLPISFDYLKNFIEERKQQMSQDQIERNINISNIIEEEKNSGRTL